MKKRDSFFFSVQDSLRCDFILPFFISSQNFWKKEKLYGTCIIFFFLDENPWGKKGVRAFKFQDRCKEFVPPPSHSLFPLPIYRYTLDLQYWHLYFLLLNIVFFLNLVATHPKCGHKCEPAIWHNMWLCHSNRAVLLYVKCGLAFHQWCLSCGKLLCAPLMAPESNCYLAKWVSTVDAALVVWNSEWQIPSEELSTL